MYGQFEGFPLRWCMKFGLVSDTDHCKINIFKAKNHPIEKENHLPNLHFLGPCYHVSASHFPLSVSRNRSKRRSRSRGGKRGSKRMSTVDR